MRAMLLRRPRQTPEAAEVALPEPQPGYRLDQANEALAGLRAGRFTGAAVLIP